MNKPTAGLTITYDLPFEIIQLILNFATDPFNLQYVLNIRLLNREKAKQLRLVPLMHHKNKTIKIQALLDACRVETFGNSKWSCFLYSRSYAMCTAKAAFNCSIELYEAVVKLFASESFMSECASGEISARQINRIVRIVAYLDRFYVKRMKLPSLESIASELISKHVS